MDALEGKVVLITGAGSGIGAGSASVLARRGARLVLIDHDQPPLDEVATRLTDLAEAEVLAVTADVRELPALEDAVRQAVDRFGGIDVVLANAGVASYGSVMAVDPADFKRVIDVNITGVFHTVRAALPTLIERHGYVLVVSSLAAFAPMPGMASYDASKAGVEHFANALRLELKHRGVDVGCAHMSWVDTPLVRDAQEDLSAFDKLKSRLPGPLKRTTPVETCAQAFVTAIEKRKRHVYVPGWVRAVAQARTLVNSPVGEIETLRQAKRLLPALDEEVRRLGRSTNARSSGKDIDPE